MSIRAHQHSRHSRLALQGKVEASRLACYHHLAFGRTASGLPFRRSRACHRHCRWRLRVWWRQERLRRKRRMRWERSAGWFWPTHRCARTRSLQTSMLQSTTRKRHTRRVHPQEHLENPLWVAPTASAPFEYRRRMRSSSRGQSSSPNRQGEHPAKGDRCS